jgi:hypothetical protein
VLGIEKLQDLAVRPIALMIFAGVDIDPGTVLLAQVRGQLHATVHWIIVPHESADKPDYNDLGSLVRGFGSILAIAGSGRGGLRDPVEHR